MYVDFISLNYETHWLDLSFCGLFKIFYILKSRKGNVKVAQSCWTLCKPLDYTIYGILQARILKWIFPTQGLNLGFLHCRQILYQLSHKGNPRILGWLAYPFSSGSSWSRNRTGVSCIAAEFFYQLSSEGSHYSKIMSSANRNNFTSSFLFWCLFFFPLLYCFNSTFSTVLDRSSESSNLVLFIILEE